LTEPANEVAQETAPSDTLLLEEQAPKEDHVLSVADQLSLNVSREESQSVETESIVDGQVESEKEEDVIEAQVSGEASATEILDCGEAEEVIVDGARGEEEEAEPTLATKDVVPPSTEIDAARSIQQQDVEQEQNGVAENIEGDLVSEARVEVVERIGQKEMNPVTVEPNGVEVDAGDDEKEEQEQVPEIEETKETSGENGDEEEDDRDEDIPELPKPVISGVGSTAEEETEKVADENAVVDGEEALAEGVGVSFEPFLLLLSSR
jgi:hypothetical protein